LIKGEIVQITKLLDKLYSIPAIGNKLHSCFVNMIASLREDLWCYVEAPYVDRIYRDAYYNFYSSKLEDYNRNCLRVSFFDHEIKPEMFFSKDGHERLSKLFVGFTVIRLLPSDKNPGRTALSPRALKRNDFICELAPIPVSVGGVKLLVEAFPFSSQDGECMTCAETSIWAVMEYFGNKYPEVKLVLPSEIQKAFQHSTRTLPSEGLTVLEIASALTNFGFGTYLYSRKVDDSGIENPTDAENFRRTLFYYIESGIPIVVGLKGKQVGHAVVAIGHEETAFSEMLNQINHELLPKSINNIVDTADLRRKLIFIDDNFPPYQPSDFAKPCTYYTDPRFTDCAIDHFVVPLNHRIYLDARKASQLLSEVIEHPSIGWKSLSTKKNLPVIKRIFLTSSNSYKSMVLQSDMHIKLKQVFQALLLPKFVWIAELSTPDIYLEAKACGLILLDATGSYRLESIKMLLYPGVTDFDFGNFSIYRNNLKGAL
jgi:hypothetical protein